MSRFTIVCPGRGSYTEASLGSLNPDHEFVIAAEQFRREYGLPSLLDLDGRRKFEPAIHLRPANVSALIYVVSMLDAQAAIEREVASGEPVCVVGNSMGWYTALAVAGSLSFADGFHLVQRMALLQEQGMAGGQLIYPQVNEDWEPVPERALAIREALAALEDVAFLSIDLGGYQVLAGDEEGLKGLRERLPAVQQGGVKYPLRLAQHGPYHTVFANGVAEEALHNLGGIPFKLPKYPLIDGRGVSWSPWSSDLHALRLYTMREQVTTPYGFKASVVKALKEYAPDRLVLLGPGNSLGGICGQILVGQAWNGIDSRARFSEVQSGPKPFLESLGRGR